MSRSARRPRRTAGAISSQPFRALVNELAPVEPLRPEQVQRIHAAAVGVLADVGMRVLSTDARARLRSAGCRPGADSDEVVRIDPDLVAEALGTAPSEFTLRARNPDHDLRFGGRNLVFCSVGGPAFVHDIDCGRRAGTMAELGDYLRVIQSLGVIHQEGGGPFEPLDLPGETRHLDVYLALCRLLDKNWQAIALGRERAADAIEMAAIALGTDRAGLAERPALMGVINTNTPLTLDAPMGDGLIELAAAGQAVCVTPFTLAGAMAPATVAGALVLQHAEALAGLVLSQLVRPGAPFVYGSFTSNVDLRSGSPAFGTPEYAKAAQISGQLARHCGLPLRSSNVTSSNVVDAQAAYESAMSLWGAVLGGANLVYHAAGWLEGGLTASFEKLIIDAEMLQMIAEYLEPLPMSDADIGLDAIAEVGHGGHFFGAAHTLERYENAFYRPLVSDWRNFETWSDDGARDAATRANAIWKQLLAEYEQPALDAAIDEALVDYATRRRHALSTG